MCQVSDLLYCRLLWVLIHQATLDLNTPECAALPGSAQLPGHLLLKGTYLFKVTYLLHSAGVFCLDHKQQ